MRKIHSLKFILWAAFVLVLVGACESISEKGYIEELYSETGPYATAHYSIVSHEIFYPSELGKDGLKHPVVIWGNGTGAIAISYKGLLEHLASWGFVVVASNSPMALSGRSMKEGMDYILGENRDPRSVFYNMIDTGSIGAAGHSQGGGGAINAAKDDRIKTTIPIAPAPVPTNGVKGSLFFITSSGDHIVFAAGVWIQYSSAKVPSLCAEFQGGNHFTPVGDGGEFRGYITAWFRSELMGDSVASDAFHGPQLICNDPERWKAEAKDLD